MTEDLIVFPPNDSRPPFSIQMSGISYCDGTYHIFRPHSELSCFEYIYKGTGTVHLGSACFTAKAGDIYFLPSGLDHLYYSDAEDPWTKIWFNITGDLVEQLINSYRLRSVNHLEGLDLSALFEEFLDTARQPMPQDQIFNRCAVLFLQIIQQMSAHVHARSADRAPTLAQRLKENMDNITDFRVPFGVMMEKLYCSESHAIRVFKAAYGITPYQYLLHKKTELAKSMLESSLLSVQEIAALLGFHDNHYFSAFFKKTAGCSPREYRQALHKKAPLAAVVS